MKLFSPILFLIFSLLTGLDSKSSTSASLASLPVDSSLQGTGQPSGSSPDASQNSTMRDRSSPQSPVTVDPEPSEMPFPVSPDISPGDFTETPISDLPETPPPNSPENSMPDLPRTPDTLQIRASKATFLKPSEITNHDLTGTPQSESPETPKLNSSKASLTGSEIPHTDPSPITHNHQKYPETPKQDAPEMLPSKIPGSPSADPTKTLDLQSPETSDPGTTDTPDSELLLTTIPDQTETLQPTFPVTHNFSLMDVIPPQFPTNYQNTTEIGTTSHLEVTTSLHMETPTSFRVEPTTPHEPHLNPKPEALGAIQVTTPEPPASGSGELKVPQNSNPKGQDTPSPSTRIVGPPAASELTNQVVPPTPRIPQRRNRGETVNTIIVVERVKETGVTLVGRPRGSTGGALCLFFAGTGLLIGIFLLLWCLYRRASRHRPFAHHRLPDSGDEPVLHLDTPKDPFDLYFYAPDAWIPSHIATKQPPSTPPLPPKLPPPPRGGRPQRLEALSPATLPNNFV